MPGSQKGDQACFLRRHSLLWVPLRFGQLLLLTNVRGIWTAAWGRMYSLFVMSMASKSLSFLHLQGSQDGAHLDQWTWDLWKGKNGISNLLVAKFPPQRSRWTIFYAEGSTVSVLVTQETHLLFYYLCYFVSGTGESHPRNAAGSLLCLLMKLGDIYIDKARVLTILQKWISGLAWSLLRSPWSMGILARKNV